MAAPISSAQSLWTEVMSKSAEECGPQTDLSLQFRSCIEFNAGELSRLASDGITASSVLNLPGRQSRFVVDNIRYVGEQNWSVFGSLDDQSIHRAQFTVVDGVVHGWLNREGETWQVKPGPQGGYALYLLDPLLLPSEVDDAIIPVEGYSYPKSVQSQKGAVISITMLVLYSADVRSRIGSANLSSFLQSWQDWMNQALENGGNGDINIEIVHAEETSYTPSGSLGTDLDRLTGTTDGYMDSVHSLRQFWDADLVHFIRGDHAQGTCGIAWRGDGSVNPGMGFGVTAESCGPSTFAHEIGHNFGMHHDSHVVSTSNPSVWPWGYGYVDPAFSFRTIMAYANQCVENTGFDCDRIQFFSDPDLLNNGSPIGIQWVPGSRSSDNARVIQETSAAVSSFSDWLSVGACAFGFYPPTVDRTVQVGSTGSISVTLVNTGSGTCQAEPFRYTATALFAGEWPVFELGSQVKGPIASGDGVVVDATYSPASLNMPSGQYFIKLEIRGGRFFDLGQIEIQGNSSNTAPSAQISAMPTSGSAPLTVVFSAAASSDPDGDALTYAWSFGDGSTSTGVSTTHTYNSEGTFTATMTVSDGSLTDQATVTVLVLASTDGDDNPWEATSVAALPYSITSTLDPELTDVDWYRIDASSVGRYTFSVESTQDTELWLYGPGDSSGDPLPSLISQDDDGGTNLNPLISEALSTTGYYFLRVSSFENDPASGKGGESTQLVSNDVGLSAAPRSIAEAQRNGIEKAMSQADAAGGASSAAASYILNITRQDLGCELTGTSFRYVSSAYDTSSIVLEIDFQNIGSSTCVNEAVRFHLYRSLGDQTTTLSLGLSQTLSLIPGATRTFSYTFVPSQSGVSPATYYPAAELLSTGVWWAFHDGSQPLVIESNSSNTAPSAQISATPTSGSAPLTVVFSAAASSDPDGDALTYAWSFGDGSTSTGVSTTHTYSPAGSYNAVLTVSDGALTSTATESISVGNANRAPQAVISASQTSGIAPIAVVLDGSGSFDPDGDSLTYEWDFGNGESSSQVITGTAFSEVGEYVVTLRVSDGTLSASASVQITVTPPNTSPVASFSFSASEGQAPLEISFDASTSSDPDGNALSYSWDFGDGSTAEGVIVTHTFQTAGVFLVKLTVSDGDLESSSSIQVSITVAVSTEAEELPHELRLRSIYPNPFDSKVRVAFDVPPSVGKVTLSVHDMLGREVLVPIPSQSMQAGIHEVTISDHLPPGVFLLLLRMDNQRVFKVLVRL